jgi:hypothetical protein
VLFRHFAFKNCIQNRLTIETAGRIIVCIEGRIQDQQPVTNVASRSGADAHNGEMSMRSMLAITVPVAPLPRCVPLARSGP